MNLRFILVSTAAVLLVACDRQAAMAERQRAAELDQQRQAEKAANDKIRELESRLDEADRQKAADREAELARVKDELAQLKQDKEQAAGRVRDLETKASEPAPTAVAEAPRAAAVQADLERVVEEEDREPVYTGRVVPETQQVASVQTFYEPLDPYGDWIETDDYGYVFRPQVSVTSTSWRPYTNGRWIHSDYGWTWESNEDFGWATYHYGRWARVSGAGWVWVPGREWGPGWVSWRRGNDYCGWAPLPPESRTRFSFTATVDRDYDLGPAAYIFISLSNFGARSYAPICAPPERNVTIIQNTVNITNINYNRANNQTVVYNGGPSYNLVRTRSKDPVEQVNVNFAQVNKTTINKTKIVNIRQGNMLQVAAPPTVAVDAPAVPSKVKAKLEKPKVDKGWEGIDSAQVQKVRQQLAASSVERKHNPRSATAVMPVVPAAASPRPERPAPVPAEPVRVAPETPKIAAPPITPALREAAPKVAPENPAPKPKSGSEAPLTPLPRAEKPTPVAPTEVPPKREVHSIPFSPATPALNRPKASAAPETEREFPKAPKVNRAPPDSAPSSVRQPVPNSGRPNAGENGERNREKAVHQATPVVEHPTRPQQPRQTPQPQPSASDPENKKKKKEKEGGQ